MSIINRWATLRDRRTQKGKQFWKWITAAILVVCMAGCIGYLTPATSIGTTTAILGGYAQCSADTSTNPCTYWFTYWGQGDTAPTTTQHVQGNFNTISGVSTHLTGLTPGKLYHSLFCGFGDTTVPSTSWVCDSPAQAGKIYWGKSLACETPSSSDCQSILSSPDRSMFGSFRTGVAASGSVPAIIGTVDLGRVKSTADIQNTLPPGSPNTPISRDGGISIAYSPNEALWLFGDTKQINGPNFINGTTAAFGSYTADQAPQDLNEVPTPGTSPLTTGLTAPQRFLPNPVGLLIPDTNTPCGATGSNSYPVSWSSGGALEPNSTKVVIFFGEVCVYNINAFPKFWTAGLGYVEWDSTTNNFSNGSTITTPFVANGSTGLPWQQNLSNPIFAGDGYLYLFTTQSRNTQTGTGLNAMYIARVPAYPSLWGNPDAYTWWSNPNGNDGSWSTDYTKATPVANFGSASTVAVSVADYSATTNHKYVALVQMRETGVGNGWGTFEAYSATNLTGPWSAGPIVNLPDTCEPSIFGCYAIEGHPELSDTSHLVYSWYSPTDQAGDTSPYSIGHVRLGSIAW